MAAVPHIFKILTVHQSDLFSAEMCDGGISGSNRISVAAACRADEWMVNRICIRVGRKNPVDLLIDICGMAGRIFILSDTLSHQLSFVPEADQGQAAGNGASI